MKAVSLEVLEDRTDRSRCDDGFLTLRRLRVRHVYEDGSHSADYACDVVSRPGVDAVAAVLWFRDASGAVQVVLKEGVRPPVYLRRAKELVHPDPEAPLLLAELVAGLVEPVDGGPDGLRRRAAAEAREEAGITLPVARFEALGAAVYPSPGAADEKVDFFAAELDETPDLDDRGHGDGSPMEEGTRALVFPLDEAITACRDGRIPDMKTELALVRLRDRLADPAGSAG